MAKLEKELHFKTKEIKSLKTKINDLEKNEIIENAHLRKEFEKAQIIKENFEGQIEKFQVFYN